MNYTFEAGVLQDLAAILEKVETATSVRKSDELETRFWNTFSLLSGRPGLGHRRHDLTDRELFFYLEQPYYVIYRKYPTHIVIHAVVHSSRDLRRFLLRR